MKANLASVFLLAALSYSSLAFAQNPVVVELFTSEGCSSCPPADAILMKLSEQHGANLILLGEHVDYWNYIGWTDRFSSAQFSRRQNDYAGALHSNVYTPQMVIDGKTQFVGNDLAEVQHKIDAATKDAMPAKATLRWDAGDRLNVKVQSPAASKIVLAVTEDGLKTSVAAGENGGRTLHHAAVVRYLRELGTANGMYDTTVEVAPQRDWNPSNLKVAVLVQDAATMKVLGAASLPYAH